VNLLQARAHPRRVVAAGPGAPLGGGDAQREGGVLLPAAVLLLRAALVLAHAADLRAGEGVVQPRGSQQQRRAGGEGGRRRARRGGVQRDLSHQRDPDGGPRRAATQGHGRGHDHQRERAQGAAHPARRVDQHHGEGEGEHGRPGVTKTLAPQHVRAQHGHEQGRGEDVQRVAVSHPSAGHAEQREGERGGLQRGAQEPTRPSLRRSSHTRRGRYQRAARGGNFSTITGRRGRRGPRR
jgi:hypothetical protein